MSRGLYNFFDLGIWTERNATISYLSTMQAKIYMVPCPIIENGISSLPPATLEVLHSLDHFIVERARTARRFIKESGHPKPIQELEILELDKHSKNPELKSFILKAKEGISIGVISEAGCPGVADPGAEIVDIAHREDIKVSPCVGPSSILLALMSSGMSGQSFCFNGYLSNKRPALVKQLRELESRSNKRQETQIFMDAPYRNEFLLTTCKEALRPDTKVCVAVDISADTEYIKTKKIKDWQTSEFKAFHKRPAIVMIG